MSSNLLWLKSVSMDTKWSMFVLTDRIIKNHNSIKNNLFSSDSYNILNYSLKHSLQIFLSKPLTNNFLKSSFFSNTKSTMIITPAQICSETLQIIN